MFKFSNGFMPGPGVARSWTALRFFSPKAAPICWRFYLVVIWFLVDKNKKVSLLKATEAPTIGLAVNQLIGFFYFHPRPYMIGLCTPLFPHGPETSFPTDHATLMFAAAFYLLAARGWVACDILLLTVTALTAWGRVYSGIHFPFDMAGSLVVGLASACLMRRIAGRLNPLNAELIQIADRLTSRIFRTKSHGARKG
jgi:undecaprenyl-diphosphatase